MTNSQSFIKLSTLVMFGVFVLLCKFSYGYSLASELRADSVNTPQTITLPKFRLGAQIGYAYKFEPIEKYFGTRPWEKKLEAKIKNSLCFGADMSYYFGKYIGVGLKYNSIYAQSKLKDNDLLYFVNSDYGALSLSEKIWIHYIGPYLSGRYFVKPNKHCLFANVGVGFIISNIKLSIKKEAFEPLFYIHVAIYYSSAAFESICCT